MDGGFSGTPPEMSADLTFKTLGSYGLRQYSGWVREEFAQQLVGRQAARVYREMLDNCSTVSSVNFAITQTMRQVEWRVEGQDDTPESAAACEFVESLMDDMSHTWNDFVSESLSMLPFGYSFHEIVYKRRMGRNPGKDENGKPLPKSKYDDGKIGLRKLPIRGQETILKWFFDEDGGIQGVTQQPWIGPLLDIPIDKGLLFRPKVHKNNPEGHALDPATPIPTPDGWTTMGALSVGDRLYDDTGRICYVTGTAEWNNRPLYDIELSDGTIIRADAEHEWRATTFNDRNNSLPARLLTTAQMHEWMSRDVTSPSFCLGQTPNIEGFNLPLPVDPYLLGYWLGDGSHETARFAVHPDDFESLNNEVVRAGYSAKHNGNRAVYVSGGFRQALIAAGLINRKHVPSAYLRASAEQRLALLQGLMDSDGTSATGKDHASKFYNSNRDLVDGVCELVRSLGGRPRVRVHQVAGRSGGTVKGRPIVATKTLWEVSFFLGKPVHRLPRKAAKQSVKSTARVTGHYVRSIKRVEDGTSKCIEVSSPSHMFLCGRSMTPTHNSIFRGAYRPWYFLKRLEEQEAIMFERFSGFPVITVPNQLLQAAASNDTAISGPAKQALEQYKKIVTNVRIDEQMGLVIPSDTYQDADGKYSSVPQYDFKLVSPSQGKAAASADTSIERYKLDIMTSVLADFLSLGHSSSSRGTQTVGEAKIDLFFKAIEGWLESNADVLNNHLLPRLWDLNGFDFDTMPRFVPDMPQRVDLDGLSNFVLRLSQAGMPLFPDEPTQEYLREVAGLPDPMEGFGMEADALSQTADADASVDANADLQKHIAGALAKRFIRKGWLTPAKPVKKRRRRATTTIKP